MARQRARRRGRFREEASPGGGFPAGTQDMESGVAAGHDGQRQEQHPRQRTLPRRRGPTEHHETPDAKNFRLILLLLNKLSPTHIERQVGTFLSEYACTGKGLVDVALKIVDRAADDARYARLHADLCVRLASEGVDDMNRPVSDVAQGLLAKCLGIARRGPCVEAFISMAARNPQASDDDEYINRVERDRFERLARKKYTGHFRFVGELYNVELFDVAAIMGFVGELIQSAGLDISTPVDDAPVVDEGRLEALCVLLETCGAKLDSADSKSKDFDTRLMSCWELLSGLCEQPINDGDSISFPLSFRMKCILLDLLELRDVGWKSARGNKLVAKTLDQIHEEAEKEGIISKSLQRRKKGIRGRKNKNGAGKDGGKGEKNIKEKSKKAVYFDDNAEG